MTRRQRIASVAALVISVCGHVYAADPTADAETGDCGTFALDHLLRSVGAARRSETKFWKRF